MCEPLTNGRRSLRAGLLRVRSVDERNDALRERDVESGLLDGGLELGLEQWFKELLAAIGQ